MWYSSVQAWHNSKGLKSEDTEVTQAGGDKNCGLQAGTGDLIAINESLMDN